MSEYTGNCRDIQLKKYKFSASQWPLETILLSLKLSKLAKFESVWCQFSNIEIQMSKDDSSMYSNMYHVCTYLEKTFPFICVFKIPGISTFSVRSCCTAECAFTRLEEGEGGGEGCNRNSP